MREVLVVALNASYVRGGDPHHIPSFVYRTLYSLKFACVDRISNSLGKLLHIISCASANL